MPGVSAAASAGQCDLADRHFLAEDHLEVNKVVRHAWSLVGLGELGRTGRATPQAPSAGPSAIPLAVRAVNCDAVGTGGGEPQCRRKL